MTNLKILEYFKYDHLPEHLQKISKPFYELAIKLATELPDSQRNIIGGEKYFALRKLLEAKDCAVRSYLG